MVLIMVLWFLIIATLLVSTVALEIRLSAKTAYHHRQATLDWALLWQGIHAAHMELMLQRMPADEDSAEIPLSERQDPRLQFDGRVLKTSYPTQSTLQIYDHAGKINWQRLSVPMLRDLLAQLLAHDDPRAIDSLLDTWQDWKDSDDLKRLNGAEKEYYLKRDPPYTPRNGEFETLDEMRLIKGFDALFKDITLDEVFTLYGEFSGVNPNLATPATLALLPGLDEAAVTEIIAARTLSPLKSVDDLHERLTPEQLQKIRPWLHFSMGNFYTIYLSTAPQDEDSAHAAPASEWAYQMIVHVDRNYNAPPRVLQVTPYARRPQSLTHK
jgi:general secretion pathway protein K